MTSPFTPKCSLAVIALGVAVLLPACSKNDPSVFIGSAKSYLAKSDYTAATIELKSALQQAPGNAEARFLLAKSLFETGDSAGAETEVRKAIDLGYPPDEAYPLLARALLAQGDFRKLITELGDRKLESESSRADLGTSIAIAQMALTETRKAQSAVDAVLTGSPNNARALTVAAQLDALNNNLPMAFKHLEAATAAAPTDADALTLKAQLESTQGRRDDAIKTLQRGIEANPNSMSMRQALVPLLIAGGELDKAVAQLDAMKKIAPNDLRTAYADALVAFSKDDAARARDSIQQVLSARPDYMPALYLSGLINLRLGSLAVAEDALRQVVAKAPTDVGATRALALTQLRAGRPALALETLLPALQRAPNDAVLLRTAGEAYLASGNVTKATQVYERANAIDKDNLGSNVRLAQVRYAAGDSARALKDLESLAAVDSRQNSADLALISAYMSHRDFTQALAAVGALEKKQPTDPLTFNVKGAVYMGMRNYKDARAAYDKVLQLQPANFPAAYALGVIDLQERKPDDARKRYDQMLAKDPKNEQLLLAQAELLALTQHRPEEVKAAIELAIAAAPTSVRPRLALLAYYTQLQDAKGLLAAAETTQSAFPNDPQVVEQLGVAQLATGAAKEALETFKRMVRLQPENPNALMRVASVEATLKDYDAAIDTLHKALVMHPEQVQAWGALAQVYIAAGRPEKAIIEARGLQKQAPDRAFGYALEAEVLASQSKWSEAAALYATALAREPLPLLAVRRYQTLQSAGKASDATAVATKWMRENPQDATMPLFLGDQNLRKKEYREAVSNYRAVLAIAPDNPAALNNMAWALIALGDPKAVEVAEKAYVQAPINPDVLDTYGWALVQTGDAGKGLELLRTAMNLAPKNDEIRLHLARALMKTGDKTGAKRELEVVAKAGKGSALSADAEKLLSGL